MLEEHSYLCSSCGEDIMIPIDFSQGANQEYVEDCPVCCHPHVIHVSIDQQGWVNVRAEHE